MTSWARGTHVFHDQLGEGVIVEEWASWHTCPECFGVLKEAGAQHCGHCRREIPYTRQIVGRQIYEIRMKDGKTYSIHRSRLRLHARKVVK